MSPNSKDKPLGGNKTQEPAQSLPSPLSELDNDLSDSDLREAAYEIVVAACRSCTKPLTFISQTEKADRASVSLSPSPSLQRSLTSSAASKLKKALGLKSKKKERGDSAKAKRSATVGELMRHQMMISEQTDSRIRRALLRVTGGQLGRHMESYVLPLELIQQLKSSDFHDQEEYEAWVTRNLKFLKAGLLLHPHLPLGKDDSAARQLGDIIDGALQKDINIGKNRESMDNLRNTVMSLACRSIHGFDSRKCHWADGCPLNLRIYQTMLEACFDVDEETSIIEEVDEVLEILKRTWVLLGINETLHNLMFSWILFQRYVVTGQVENDLLVASSNLMEKVEEEANSLNEPIYTKILRSTSNLILGWAEKRLLAYHDFFGSGNLESMESVASLAVLSGKILVEDKHCENNQDDPTDSRIHSYISSSSHAAFSQKLEKVKNAPENQKNSLPLLCILAQEVTELAFNEKDKFGPILKRWDPLAAGSAVAILHSCYRNELKQFLEGVNELTPDTVQVLLAADKLEKDLVQIAVETSVDSEDGGKSIIMEMPPYDIEAVITNLVKSWIKLRVDTLKEWIDRNLKLEAWSQHSNKECLAPSVVEVLRIVDEIFEAFFMLPVPMNPSLLFELMTGVDKCLERYALKTKSGCGNRNTFIPTMHPLTRCSAGSKFPGVFKKKERQHVRRTSLVGSLGGKRSIGSMSGKRSIGIPQLCVRINTLQHIQVELRVMEKTVFDKLKSSQFTDEDKTSGVSTTKFEHSANTCAEAVQQLCEAIAYKIVFRELNHVFWEGLYVGYVSSSRIESFLQELDHYMEIISSTVDERIKMDVIIDIMKASFDGFLLVLLAGGPTRSFFLEDYDTIEEDFKFLCDLFFANGEGVPMELIEKFSVRVNRILPLFHRETEKLIEQYTEQLSLQDHESSSESSSKTHLPLPPTSGLWSPNEANTVLRVLCHRNDEVAAKFLKKTYNLPTKLHKEVSCMVYKWD